VKEIFKAASEALARGESAVLSTIVASSGSLPMSRRSKLLLLSGGKFKGTVGGGCLEAEVCQQARQVLSTGLPVLEKFVLTEEEAGEGGLNCGGTVRIFTEVLSPGPVEDVIRGCLKKLSMREPAVLVSSLGPDGAPTAGKILISQDGSRTGTLGRPAWDDVATQFAGQLDGSGGFRMEALPEGGKLFLEPLSVIPAVVLFGGGHISREVARVATAAGFRVVVVDDRAEYASPERHPDADETLVLPFGHAVDRLAVDEQTYLVVVTRGHQYDEVVLRKALRSGAAYVGMIGSKRKVAIARKNLAAEDYTDEELDRLHAPIGLEIGADGPQEIAVSIVAELIAVRRLGSHAASMRLSTTKKG
jgi:xanthine dehydrogenase accessory factor